MYFNLFCCKILKTRIYHQLNKHNTTSYNTLSHNDLVWFKLMHSCMHTCLCLIHFELVCLSLYVCVFARLWRGSELHLWLLCLYWLLWSSRQVTLISHLYFSICISAFQLVCMIGILFSKYMLCLEHPVVCSHPKPLLGKSFSHTWLLHNCCLFILVVDIFLNFEN